MRTGRGTPRQNGYPLRPFDAQEVHKTSTEPGEDMEFASLDVPWGEDAAARRMNRLRWTITVVYIVLVLALALVPFAWPDLGEGPFVVVYLVVVIGGAILLIAVLSYPVVRSREGDVTKLEGLVSEGGVTRRLRPGETYYLRIRFKLILYIMVPVVVMMAVVLVVIPDRTAQATVGATTIALVIITGVFSTLEVRADREELSFGFSVLRKVIPLDAVHSIDVTKVNALKDYMGWGVRVGPDGSIGYIVQGDKGFRVVTSDGKRYVVTIPDPDALVEYVLAAKAERARDRT